MGELFIIVLFVSSVTLVDPHTDIAKPPELKAVYLRRRRDQRRETP